MKLWVARKEIQSASRFVLGGRGFALPRSARTVLMGVAVLGIAVAGVVLVRAVGRDHSVTIIRDGTVVDGRQIDGYVQVKANNVTIKNVTVRYGGSYAIRVFSGFVGTVIESSKIYCPAGRTNGARAVHRGITWDRPTNVWLRTRLPVLG